VITTEISLAFGGNCEEAFDFYAQTLSGTVTNRLPWGHSPLAHTVPPEWADKLLHARLQIADTSIAGGDIHPGEYAPPRGFAVLLGVATVEEANRVFTALATGGRITVALQETFWSVRYGALVDRFGIPWEINCRMAS